MASSKLKNLHAIRQILDGEHRTQTRKSFTYGDAASNAEKNKVRAIGEIWNEYNEHGEVRAVWEQKQGYRVKHGSTWTPEREKLNEEIRDFLDAYPNCLHEECKTKHKTRLDKKFQSKTGMCSDCVFEMEAKIITDGKYRDYEREKMLANAEAFFKDADSEIAVVVNALKTSQPEFTFEDGRTEKWVDDSNTADKLLEEYNEAKRITLEQLNNYGREE